MSSAEYVPIARGALKLKGVPQASKSHRKKKAKPEPLAALKDPKDEDREKTGDDKLERQIKSGSRDREDEERDDRKDEEQGGEDTGEKREREEELDSKEQREIAFSRGKTAAEMRHEERRKKKV